MKNPASRQSLHNASVLWSGSFSGVEKTVTLNQLLAPGENAIGVPAVYHGLSSRPKLSSEHADGNVVEGPASLPKPPSSLFCVAFVAFFALFLCAAQARPQQLVSVPRGDGVQTPMRVYVPAGTSCTPLAIISHGAGGSENGYTYLAEGLKDHGWLTIVVGHKESGPTVLRSQIFHHGIRNGVQNMVADANAYKDRFLDIGAALQWAATKCKPPYKVLLGHSMGAETVLLEAGAQNNLGLTGANRFNAYVAISPAGVGSVFPSHAWHPIHKPVLVLTGTKDRSPTGDWHSRTDSYYDLPPGCHWLGVIDGATHLNFAGIGFGAAKTEALALPLIYSFLNDAQKGECPLPPKAAGLTLSAK